MSVCRKCNRENPDNAQRCVFCGEPLSAVSAPQYTQPQYAPPMYEPPRYDQSAYISNYKADSSDDLVSVGTWVLIMLGGAIPVLNLVLWVWLMISARQPSLKCYGKGMLILTAVVVGVIVVLALVMMIFFAQVFAAVMDGITIE